MSSLNEVKLIGRIGKDPVPHIFPDGTTIVGFSLATSDKWKDKATQEWKEKTEWHNISVKNPFAVDLITTQCNKGDLIYISGELCTRKWVKKDGSEHVTTEVVVQPFGGSVKLLKKNDEAAKTYIEPVAYDKRKAQTQAKIEAQLEDDDVPF